MPRRRRPAKKKPEKAATLPKCWQFFYNLSELKFNALALDMAYLHLTTPTVLTPENLAEHIRATEVAHSALHQMFDLLGPDDTKALCARFGKLVLNEIDEAGEEES